MILLQNDGQRYFSYDYIKQKLNESFLDGKVIIFSIKSEKIFTRLKQKRVSREKN